jgi:3'-5' exoribonuclease
MEKKVLLTGVESRTTSSGDPYIHGTLRTEDGDQYMLRIWDESTFPVDPHVVLRARGRTTTYKGQQQFVVDSYTVLDDESIGPFLDGDPDRAKTHYTDVIEHLQQTPSEGTSLTDQVVDFIRDRLDQDRLLRAPASSNHHHGEQGGLIRHTASMVKAIRRMIRHYHNRGFDLDQDALVAATVLHDLGKIKTRTLTGDRTHRGDLEGHIAVAHQWIDRHVEANNKDRLILLRHLILSHHGQKKWGSPVEPKTPEAIILHTIDMMDAQLDTLSRE